MYPVIFGMLTATIYTQLINDHVKYIPLFSWIGYSNQQTMIARLERAHPCLIVASVQ